MIPEVKGLKEILSKRIQSLGSRRNK